MRIVVISDTHGKHDEIGVLSGDVLIHCGDSCNGFRSDPADVVRLDAWFGRQRFDRILCIGGNHDFALQELTADGRRALHNAEYLEDREYRYKGLRFYGSPWTPELPEWAYFQPDHAIASRWARIPDDTDVLITHTPPRDVLDRDRSGQRLGCPHLRRRVGEVRPTLHCFGHVHASSGAIDIAGITFVNAALVNRRFEVTKGAYVFDL